jgi:hypothetical protein
MRVVMMWRSTSHQARERSTRWFVGHACRGSVAATLALVAALAGRPVHACSAANPAATPATAVPRDGSTDVPTYTSFVVLSAWPPVDVALQAGGVAVPLEPPTSVGFGEGDMMSQPVGYWQVKASAGALPASSELVLSMAGSQGGRVVLTTVHTAPGYDKQLGTPATLKSLKLTRVRHPLAEIASGDCLFSEYVGYVTFDADPAVIPGTPQGSVVNMITVAPKHGGGAVQGRSYTGVRPYSGVPVGVLQPSSWQPDLDPTLEYCASISSFGFGDLARLSVVSNTVCARVEEVSLPGAEGDVGADGGADAIGAPDAAPSAAPDAARDASSAQGDASNPSCAPNGATDRPGAVGDGPPSCSVSGRATRPSPIVLVMMAAGLLLRRRLRA